MSIAYRNEPYKEEVINGEHIIDMSSPTVNHNFIISKLTAVFDEYFKFKTCKMFHENLDVFINDENIVQPDWFVVCDPNKIKSNGIYGAPDFVIEVLSPSTAKYDMISKKNLYEKSGVREYWVINQYEKLIHVHELIDGVLVLKNVYSGDEKIAPISFPDFEVYVNEIYRNCIFLE
ncbi:MAG: Uma2 family endonuclease [Clostridiales bacterium]|nr:Uma2 family endonuclease [Clostridiales bacterium]